MRMIKLTNEMVISLAPIIVDNEIAIDDLHFKYLFRNYIGMNFITYNDDWDGESAFHDLFNQFAYTYRNMYEKSYRTLKLEYNPLENYNSTTETIHGKRHETERTNYGSRNVKNAVLHGARQDSVSTVFGSHSDTETATVGTRISEEMEELHPYGYNSNDYSNSDKTITSKTNQGATDSTKTDYGQHTDNTNNTYGAYEDKNETTNSAYEDSNEKDSVEYTDVEKKSGNIGVMTSQQMVSSQLELDKYNLNKWFIDLFAHDNLFYC